MKILLVLMSSLLCVACDRSDHASGAASTANPQAQTSANEKASRRVGLDSQIPPHDAEKYKNIRDAANWRNPSLMIVPDGASLRTNSARNKENKAAPVDALRDELIALPLSDWPYGRVVAAGETPIRSLREEDERRIERNRLEVEEMLKSLGVEVTWWPSN